MFGLIAGILGLVAAAKHKFIEMNTTEEDQQKQKQQKQIQQQVDEHKLEQQNHFVKQEAKVLSAKKSKR